MRIVIDIDVESWKVLKPVLQPMVVNEIIGGEDTMPYDKKAILSLPHGVRIISVLNDGQWDASYTPTVINSFRSPDYIVTTVEQLKRITWKEWCYHRNAGKKGWEELQAYVQTLK